MAFRPNRPAYKFLVSACLAGVNCTYRGKNNLNRHIKKLVDDKRAIAICPEILGGLGIPRENSETTAGSGEGVLAKNARVLTPSGRDVSKEFIAGAKKALGIAKKYNIKIAILKSKSPSCGFGKIYDGTFKGILKEGNGVCASLLSRNGIAVYNEKDIMLEKFLR